MRTLAFLLCLAPVLAWAGDDLQQAAELFGRMEYDQALKLVEQVAKSSSSGPTELVEAFRIQGLCLAVLGRTPESVEAFRKLLAIDPNFRLSKDVSPKLSPPYHQALGMAAEQKPITLIHQSPEPPEILAGFELRASIQSDPLGMVKGVRLRYWSGSGSSEEKRKGVPIQGIGVVSLKLPAKFDKIDITYYFEATNEYGGVLARAGSQGSPYHLRAFGTLPVVAKPTEPGADKIQVRSESNAAGGGRVSAPFVVADKKEFTEAEGDGRRKDRRWYQTWWFWTAVGAVVAGAAAGTALALSSNRDSGLTYYDIKWMVKP